MASARGWIEGDETAKEMLGRLFTEKPLLLLPQPLHRLPLRFGNVVEIVGNSPSAKTDILIQTAISCILPKEWNGVHYGGLEYVVMYFDLDCRFDIRRLSQSLKHRLMQSYRLQNIVTPEQNDVGVAKHTSKVIHNEYDKELFEVCLRRFLYVRCYSSYEFLAAMKILHYQLEKESKTDGPGVRLLMIDSIGAYYWIDRASSSLPQGGTNRKNLSLQNVSEAVVQEIRKLLLVHPLLVLAAKTEYLRDEYPTKQGKRSLRSWPLRTSDERNVKNVSYREYMPSIWQSFVTYRILVRASEDERKLENQTSYLSEWLLPALKVSDKLFVTDAGILMD